MKPASRLRSHLAGLAVAGALGLAITAPAHAGLALGFVQNETAGTSPNGDYNIDYNAYAADPSQFLAFGPRISLGTSSVLTFKAFVGDEFGPGTDPEFFDQFSVWASMDGATIGANVLASSSPSLGGVSIAEWGGVPGYVEVTVDLSSYAAMAISLAFSFDPLDDVNNGFAGVRVDDIRVTQGGSTLFSENFDSGSAAGWQLNGLWHLTDNFAVSAVPEPSSLSLLAACVLGAGLSRRRRLTVGR